MKPTLADIVANKQLEVAQRKNNCALAIIQSDLQPAEGIFLEAISVQNINLIAEIKPQSPSAGILRAAGEINVTELVASYSKYASAISVLTDQKYFGGSLDLLGQVSKLATVPTLCKDFIIDPYQIFEARKAGAEAILLIAKILSDSQLKQLFNEAKELRMTPVVEVQNPDEVQRAVKLDPEVLLINNRDLSTFEIDRKTTVSLAALIPRSIAIISASGIESAADIHSLLATTNKFLVGSSIMRADDVQLKLAELCGATMQCAE